jgi:hypothetical protein
LIVREIGQVAAMQADGHDGSSAGIVSRYIRSATKCQPAGMDPNADATKAGSPI